MPALRPAVSLGARAGPLWFAGKSRGEPLPAEPRRPAILIGADRGERLPRPDALALEMALQEKAERRALEGELGQLEAAWREADEIADIADRLPEDPLEGWRG